MLSVDRELGDLAASLGVGLLRTFACEMARSRCERNNFLKRHAGPDLVGRQSGDIAEAIIQNHQPLVGVVHAKPLRHILEGGGET